jgi:hypothetical protein
MDNPKVFAGKIIDNFRILHKLVKTFVCIRGRNLLLMQIRLTGSGADTKTKPCLITNLARNGLRYPIDERLRYSTKKSHISII